MLLDFASVVLALAGVLAGAGVMFLPITRNTYRKAGSPHD